MRLPKKENIKSIDNEDPLPRYYQPVVKGAYIKRLQMALDCLEDKKFDKILEIGYGSGIFFPELVSHCNKLYGLEIFGKEGEDKIVDMMKKENINVELVNGSILKMPFKENYFDAVICISTMEHLQPDELKQALRESRRVLKKGGMAVFGFPADKKIMDLYFTLIRRELHFDCHHSSHKLIIEEISKDFNILEIKKFIPFSPIYYVVKCRKEKADL